MTTTMHTSKAVSTMKLMFAAVAALVAASVSVRAQITSTTVTEVTQSDTASPTTNAPTTTTSSGLVGTMTVQCWKTTILGGSAASLAIDATAASTVTGAVCYEVFPLSGGIVSIPVTPGPDFQPLSLQSSLSAAAASAASVSSASAVASAAANENTSSSSSNLVRILVPVLLGSLAGIVLLSLATLHFLRTRRRRKTQNSRASRWTERNSRSFSESWAMKESPSMQEGRKPEPA